MEWYVRSARHTDAHYGQLAGDGSVSARCGRSFTPEPELFGAGPRVLAPPVDPARCCPECLAGRGDDAQALRSLVEGL